MWVVLTKVFNAMGYYVSLLAAGARVISPLAFG